MYLHYETAGILEECLPNRTAPLLALLRQSDTIPKADVHTEMTDAKFESMALTAFEWQIIKVTNIMVILYCVYKLCKCA